MYEPRAVSDVDLDALRVQVEGLDLEENKLGHGAYGVIYQVTVNGKKCIAKKLHNILIQAIKYYPQGQDDSIVKKFKNECRILSQLEHPNVVSFVGIHYGHDRNDISLIMERLHCDLADFVRKNPGTPLCDRLHILYNVSKGLDYLHSQSPPLIHRDLTAPNVLLTEDLTAKIGDLGVSRYVDPTVATKLTTNPGNRYYMPPESHDENPHYTTKLDIFSFGNLITHTITGDFPRVFRLSPNDPNFSQYVQEGKVELMRRNTAVHKKMGETHCLYPLVVHCLHDSPEQRPSVGEVRRSLRKLCLKNYPEMTLLEACKTGNMKVIYMLLEGGADPNQADEDKQTALHMASMNGIDEVVRVLIFACASVNTQNKWGESPLWIASFHGHQKIVELLIKAGANADVLKKDGSTALLVASQEGHREGARMLEAKAVVDVKTNDKSTTLQHATENRHDEVVRGFLTAKAAVKPQNKLIEAGANVNAKENDVVEHKQLTSQQELIATIDLRDSISDLNTTISNLAFKVDAIHHTVESIIQKSPRDQSQDLETHAQTHMLESLPPQQGEVNQFSSQQENDKPYVADFLENWGSIMTLGILKDSCSIRKVNVGLGECLGDGGFGDVYKLKMPGGEFAAKVFDQKFIKNSSDQLKREIDILRRCSEDNNEHIVKYHGICRIRALSDGPVVIMELMEMNFESYYMKKKPTFKCTIEILTQVAEGLEYLHCKCSPKVVHRDLTARNVLLANCGSQHPLAKITDFGLSQFVHSLEKIATMSKVVATRYYLAPEIDTTKHRYNAKVDIFSFGHLALVSSIQRIIDELPDVRMPGVGDLLLQARSEVDRRAKHLVDLRWMHFKGKTHSYEDLLKSCLDLDHLKRPTATELVQKLRVTATCFNSYDSCGSPSCSDHEEYIGLN